MSYKSARGYVPLKRRSTPVPWPTYDDVPLYRPCSATRREGDEMACQCGKRWSIGEDHP